VRAAHVSVESSGNKMRDAQKPHADRRRVLGAKLAYVCICRSHSGQYLCMYM
jgi:hypothetical protein